MSVDIATYVHDLAVAAKVLNKGRGSSRRDVVVLHADIGDIVPAAFGDLIGNTNNGDPCIIDLLNGRRNSACIRRRDQIDVGRIQQRLLKQLDLFFVAVCGNGAENIQLPAVLVALLLHGVGEVGPVGAAELLDKQNDTLVFNVAGDGRAVAAAVRSGGRGIITGGVLVIAAAGKEAGSKREDEHQCEDSSDLHFRSLLWFLFSLL